MDYKKIFRDRERRLKLISKLSFIPDAPYLKLVYRIKTGRKLNLKNPTGFNEKLNWLKLHNIHPEYTQLADKLAVREVIKEKLGEEYLIPLLGHWKSYDEIDFSVLPDRFVLKCNHDSGSVKIIKDKSQMNHKELKAFFDGRLRINPFCLGREYPYKDIPPCIIAEQYMEPKNGGCIADYKFFVFHGKPEVMFIVTDRDTDTRFDYFDMNFNRLDITHDTYPCSVNAISMPKTFHRMCEIANSLCENMPFVRLDFYELDGQIYFGEFTFFNAGGFRLITPDCWERKLGDFIRLEERT